MASVSSNLDETTALLQGTRMNNKQETLDKMSKNKKSLEEGKVLRKQIRSLRREDEKQAKSLTQDLKDIRESLSDINNLNKIFDGSEYYKYSTRTKRIQGKNNERSDRHYEGKTNGNKKCSSLDDKCADSSSMKQERSSHQRKTVRFKEDEDGDLEQRDLPSNEKQHEVVLSLSSIDLK